MIVAPGVPVYVPAASSRIPSIIAAMRWSFSGDVKTAIVRGVGERARPIRVRPEAEPLPNGLA
jgi:hypothetical protein